MVKLIFQTHPSDSGKQLDTRNGQNEVNLWAERFGKREDSRFEIVLAKRDAIQVGAYIRKLLHLL
jgi:hypothetical protein